MGKWDGNVKARINGDMDSVWDREMSARDKACKVLGLDPKAELTKDMVRDAFHNMVKRGHADAGGTLDMDTVKQARNILINQSREKPSGIIATRCGVCNGAGSVRAGTGFQSITCPSCHGLGEKS